MSVSPGQMTALLLQHRDAQGFDRAKAGETPADLLKRLGLKGAEELPEFRSSFPPAATPSNDEDISRWAARFIRQHLLPRFMGGGYSQLELDALVGPQATTVEVNQKDNRQLKKQLLRRLTTFADRWDPQHDENWLGRMDHIERLRERLENRPPDTEGLRP
ncbi:hypothetical protein AVMA1855_15100 [Acidovorax sp. SUPP1855]|uniref:hypothetical protein n=1 Tax=Acidovorax sp. SUPP1855 TaxID=431774 RepID=UPI0023DE3B5C|nr:hypothetical protein [Acidovorax sp. SUPP1855]GKS85494.1 hypothetical protein AVMA1855_15100 [Acidovorax sp. SUPP1855]